MPEVALRSVTKRYPDGSVAVDGINLTIGDGELVALIGPSGSGKTTILRLIAGLEHPTAGEITFDGRSVVEVAPERRGVALVAQPEGLYPHLDVRDNLAFPLRAAGRERATARSRVEREAGRMGLRRLLDLLPGGLSAGQRGRVATGRALMRGAPVLLLDEPLAQADAGARDRLRGELRRLHRDLATTALMATNDQAEAMAVADRIAVLHEGRLQQVGGPNELYSGPANLFVARFVGSPPMNTFPGTVRRLGAGWVLEVGEDRLAAHALVESLENVPADGTRVVVGARPEHLRPARPGAPFDRCLHGRVALVEDLGRRRHLHFGLGRAAAPAYVAVDRSSVPRSPGDQVEVEVEVDRLLLFAPATGRRLS